MTHPFTGSSTGHIVRLSTGGNLIGSGFIVQSVESQQTYVLTARHCLLSIDPDRAITIDFFNEATASFDYSLSLLDRLYFEQLTDYDVALLPLLADKLPAKLTLPTLYKTIPKGYTCSFIGFPVSLQGKQPHEVVGNTSLSVQNRTNIKTTQQFENNESDSAETTKGYSGSGLLIDAEESRGLAGIITHFHKDNNEFTAYNLAKLNELLSNHALPLLCLLEPRPGTKVVADSTTFDFFSQVQSTLTTAEEYLANLQPRQALTLVEPLVQSISESTIAKSKRDQLLAKCESIRVFAQFDLQIPVEINTWLITIYLLDKDNKKYQERAVLAYYDQDKREEADELAEQILDEDGENPRAWSVYHKLHPNFPPPQSVLAKVEYKMGILEHLVNRSAYEQTEGMINLFAVELAQRNLPDRITRPNLYYWNYVAQTAMANGFRQADQLMSLEKPTGFRTNVQLAYARDLFEIICKTINKTPFQEYEHFTVSRFNFCLCTYLLTDDPEQERLMTQELYQLFIGDQSKRPSFLRQHTHTPIIESMPSRLLELLTFFLQQNQPELVVNSMKAVREIPTPDTYYLLGKAYDLLGQKELMVEAYQQYLLNQLLIDQHTATNCISLVRDLLLADQQSDDIARWLTEGKTFDDSYLEPLLKAYCWCGSKSTREKAKQTADGVYPYWNELRRPLKRGLAIIYSMAKEWARAKTLWKELIEESDQPTEELRNYLIALYGDYTEFEEIKKQFEHWRISFAPDEQLIDLELNLYRNLDVYDKLADISLFGLSHFPSSDQYWLDAISGLSRQKKDPQLMPLLDERILTVPLPALTRFQIALIYLSNQQITLGLEACYVALKENWANPDVKSAYLSLANQFKYIFSDPKPDKVLPDMVVQISGQNKIEWLELTPQALSYNSIAKAALNLGIGNTFRLDSIISGQFDDYRIEKIANKYEGQQTLILQEINQNAHHGGPFRIFTLPNTEDPDVILNYLETIVGPHQKERDVIREELIQDFSSRKLGFYQLTRGAFTSNPVGTWEYITHHQVDFPIYPLILLKAYLPSIILDASLTFVLDLSSLLTLFKLSTQQGNPFLYQEKPFVVSQFTIDFVASELDKALSKDDSGISLGYYKDQFMPFFAPDNFQDQRIAYWSSLKEWISLNCQADYVWERLRIQRDNPEYDQLFKGNDYYSSSFFDTFLLSNNPKRILVSDDLFHYTSLDLGAGRRVTTEWYLKTVWSAPMKTNLWKELVKLNMRGLSLTGNQLFEAYTSETDIGSTNNFFKQALQNFAPRCNPATNATLELINFIKYVFTMKLALGNKEAIEWKKSVIKEVIHDVFFDVDSLPQASVTLILNQINYELSASATICEFVKKEFRKYVAVKSSSN